MWSELPTIDNLYSHAHKFVPVSDKLGYKLDVIKQYCVTDFNLVLRSEFPNTSTNGW